MMTQYEIYNLYILVGFDCLDTPASGERHMTCSGITQPTNPTSDADIQTQSLSGLEYWVYPGKTITLQCPQAEQGTKVHWLILYQDQWEIMNPRNLSKYQLNGTYQFVDIQNGKLKFFSLPKNLSCGHPNLDSKSNIYVDECNRLNTRYMCMVTYWGGIVSLSTSVIVRPTISKLQYYEDTRNYFVSESF